MSYLYPRMCVIMFFRLTIIWLYTYCLCCQHKLPTTVFIHTYSTKYSFIIVYNILANKKEEVYRQEECYHLPSYTQKPERSIASRCRCFTDGSCHRRWGKSGWFFTASQSSHCAENRNNFLCVNCSLFIRLGGLALELKQQLLVCY